MATEMVLNDAAYKLFGPDLEEPTRDDFVRAAGTLNALPLPPTESSDISAEVLHLVGNSGRGRHR
ncbi:hypothetical protein [Rhodococcus opacus]|uniref:hypothetical protein n=1 Tax=Rhodococcus opacus TaxID=37919 RepID=UPI002475BFA9|nr:hypothetical protein [Rhodococcus opacus]MDH6291303.1 hypothetical protein [Rhodococcus opacus]